MALDATSSRADVQSAIKNNLRYERDGSVTMARDLVEAIDHYLIFHLPVRMSTGNIGGEVELDPEQAAKIRDQAKAWIAVNANGSRRVTHFDFSNFRQ